jgi:biopolymer transport protein ExbB
LIRVLLGGGILMLPILLLSVAAGYVIVERLLFFWHTREFDPDLAGGLSVALRERSARELYATIKDRRSAEARLLVAGLRSGRRLAEVQRQRQLDLVAQKELAAMEHNVPYLQNIANVATLLGLLGTVTGMISAFLGMRASGSADLDALAGGISQALVTTAAGLSVAIPSTLFHHLFVERVQRTTARLNIIATELSTHFGAP